MMNDFKKQAEIFLGELGRASDEFPWHSKACYADWCAQTYYYVAHSTRLLALGAARFQMDRDDLHQRFLKHAHEEKRHEQLAVNDLKALGGSLRDFPEHPETKSFYQVQYYWIDRVNPTAFFGYILALEGFAVLKGSGVFERTSKLYGEKACMFLKVHTADDPEHLETAYKMAEALSPAEQRLVLDCLDQSCGQYIAMMKKIAAQAGAKTSTLARAA